MKYILIALIGLVWSCKTSEMTSTFKAINANETWLVEPSFEINCTVAYPLVTNELSQLSNNNLLGGGNTANRINLQGRGDFIRITNTNVEADLSYYGTRRIASRNTSDTGIVLNDPVQDYTVSSNEKKNSTHITFKSSHDQEQYEFYITVYASGNCEIDVNSSKRNSIRYSGKIKEFVVE